MDSCNKVRRITTFANGVEEAVQLMICSRSLSSLRSNLRIALAVASDKRGYILCLHACESSNTMLHATIITSRAYDE